MRLRAAKKIIFKFGLVRQRLATWRRAKRRFLRHLCRRRRDEYRLAT